jgi:sugar lactone lactonase YvrE
VTLGATNAIGTGNATLTITVAAAGVAPIITNSPLTAAGTVGTPFSFTITATGSPTSYAASPLPAGLSIVAATGVITGTPTTAGTMAVTLGATNATGSTTATLTITINPPAPVITNANTAGGMTGVAFSYTITATNSPTSYNATGLPAGLSVNTATGAITGTPTAVGVSTVTLSATNAGGTGTATLTLTIASGAPVITSATAAIGTVGSAFSYTITATRSPTGYNATGVPAGLSVNTATGAITGTPTAVGVSTITLSATNAGGTGTATLALTIRGVTAAVTVAGQAGTSGSTDGAGTDARFNFPSDVVVDAAGNLYVVDSSNHTVRKTNTAGVTSTFAGVAGVSGSADGTGNAARFDFPAGLAIDGSGNLYVADTGNNTIRKITTAGVVSTFAGVAGASGSADGTGSGARFAGPADVAVDSTGTLYVADSGNSTIRMVTATGVVTTFAGVAGASGSADGTGSAARFFSPEGVAVTGGATTVVYVADTNNDIIRLVTAGGAVSTLAGVAGSVGSADGFGSAVRFNNPAQLTVDNSSNVYVSDTDNDTIRLITGGGAVGTLAGLAGVTGFADGIGSAARFNHPTGLSVDTTGDIYVADTDNHIIRVVAALSAPQVVTEPQNLILDLGMQAVFSVVAVGVPAPTYQWYRNGAAIAGATAATVTIPSTQLSDAGTYAVALTNAAGTVTSSSATLTFTASSTGGPWRTSGGGGAVEPRFALALAILWALRSFRLRRASRRS